MASSDFPVAIIGMAVKLPGANSCNEFWQLMVNGEDTVADFPQKRAADIQHALEPFQGQLVNENKPFFTGSFFKSVDKFDANLFQINPREALFIEPEQRIFLETVWELLEDAGYASSIRGSKTGVYVGNTVNKYKYILTENHPSISHGNHSPFISSRVSYTYDLKGPAMMVATGCSSSLLAVHLACQGLLTKDCEMAIAGGITLDLLPISTKTDIWNQLGITGPNVRCRAFDASAGGIAKGEGCGVVLLKPVHKALSDGDFIYGVLKATTANQDGHSNGITAPHPGAQANMLYQAWKLANITPENLDYFEAHGTGTELGDPIEISGITNAFKMFGITFSGGNENKIPIGSVKANIGHLADGAAGIVALIKTLLCIQKNKIPPTVNFSEPNPHINWKTAPVYVNTSPLDWNPHEDRSLRLASVSAFGLLGTNIHAIVSEHRATGESVPKQLSVAKGSEVHLLIIAANTKQSLVEFVAKMVQYFNSSEDKGIVLLKNVCYTINTGRELARFQHRAVAYANNWDRMACTLEQLLRTLTEGSLLEDAVQNDSNAGQSTSYSVHHRVLCSGPSANAALDFLEGKIVPWKEFYLAVDSTELKKLPLIPTYAFDRVRFWPNMGKSINKELLQLEHKLLEEYQDVSTDVVKTNLESTSSNPMFIERVIQTALNEALSTMHDWNKMADENLFMLGVDSLICTQVCTKLQDKINICFSMAELHINPTFSGLKNLIKGKVTSKPKTKTSCPNVEPHTQTPGAPTDVSDLLEKALNKALGTDCNWQKLEDENLFTLGVDSLIYTHVNMELKDTLGLAVPFTMAELHENPSYRGLIEVIMAKIKLLKSECNVGKSETNSTANTSTESAVKLYPTSFSQRRLWVMQEMATNPCAYNATNCLKITGDFHPAAFVQSANTVLSCHGSFYIVFVDIPGGPMQTHNWKLEVTVEESDLQSFGDKAEDVAMRLYDKDYRTLFDLRQGPLVRCKLYHLPKGNYYFTMVVHHVVIDGWSHFIFYNELWDTYINFSKGQRVASSLHKPLFAEFAREEQLNAESSGSKAEKDLIYWKDKLSGFLPFTTLPGDRKRPPIFTYNGRRITHFISHDTIKSLQQSLADKYTIFMSLLSAVYVLIHYYTGDKDLIIGTPVAGRTDMKFNHVIGCFINTLALRVQIKENFSFLEVLEAVSKVCLEAYDHQLAPFDHLVSHLNLPRDTSITPVFSVNVCYHNTEIRADHVSPPDELQVERKLLHNDSAKWDLYFDFLQEPEGLRLTLEYYTGVFSDSYAEGIMENLLALLKFVSQEPSLTISELSLTMPSSHKQTPNNSSILYGPIRNLGAKTVPELLLESLKLHAEHSFIVKINGMSMAYGELLDKCEKLAVFLREHCRLPKQSRTGLLLDNSSEALESILACVLSGLVYVPLDSNSPKSRLEHICNEAELKAIIFSKFHLALANHLQWACSSMTTIVCVDGQDIEDLQEVHNAPLMDTELWNCVASTAKDDIEGGGWKSSYTGEHISADEMDEYTENVFTKLKAYLHPESTVLEIGCASGLTTQTLCQHVNLYVATDISDSMVKYLKRKLHRKGLSNVEVYCTPANEVGHMFQGQRFDVIIMNSVVHCFPGHNYLRKVLSVCEELLTEDGVIFIGDIMDLDVKEKLVASLKSFKKAHPGHRVKTEWHNELFLSRKFIQHLRISSPVLKSVSCSRKLYTIPNELTEFRFDAIFTKSSSNNDTPISLDQKAAYAISDILKAVESKVCSISDIHETVSKWTKDVELRDEVYILYTSGTTGTPKGVIIGHEALLNYVSWAITAYKFHTTTSTPFFAPLTFDFTITSIFPPLLSGSTIHIFKNFQESYLTMGSCNHLTTVKFSPLQLDTIISATKESLSASVFILGGEELTCTLLAKLKENKLNESFVVWNEYGPTEATVGCVVRCFVSEKLPLDPSELVPIGKPIDNVTIAVVRDNYKPVPVGGKGKLSIGGKCLCSDFAARTGAAKEAERNKSFSAACWGRPGEQMLLTDDIAEVIPTTTELAYFGREKDCNTIKVNGVRVDLMEVQYAIENNDLVNSAWVCSFMYKDHTYLGAATKLKHTAQWESCGKTWKQSLTSYLAQILPSRAIPKVIITVLDPPTNVNGKKDVPLLQRLFTAEMDTNGKDSDNEQNSSTFNSTLVSKLQMIWQSILPINHLPHLDEDFFFDLSGDSLQAIHLIRKMRDQGFKVSVTDIFQNPCIGKLIPILQETATESTVMFPAETEQDIKFKPTPIVEEYFTRSPSPTHPDHFALPVLLSFHNNLEEKILKLALRGVMNKHGSLRSTFEVSKGTILQQAKQLHPEQPNIVKLNITRKCRRLANEPEFFNLCQELEESHSLLEGIVLNAGIINLTEKAADRCSKEHTYALLMVHHAAVDIVSWQQILEDLASALRQLSQDDSREPVLQGCMLPFATYCEALHAEARTGIFSSEVSYWRDVGKQCLESGQLIKSNSQSRFKSAKWLSKSIDASTVRSISTKLESSNEHVILTAFGRSMSSIHGKDISAICLESHGRHLSSMDSTDTVGWCTSMFPFVLETPLIEDPVSQIKLVGTKINQIPNHGLGFGLLRSAGKLKISHPNIMFVFQGSLDASSKKTFDGSKFNFDYIPWIEIMLSELNHGRFHRHPEEFLVFDLEIISWIHGGELKFGCLFDKETVSESLVDNILQLADMNLKAFAKKACSKANKIKVEVIPSFKITPDCVKIIQSGLRLHNISADEMKVHSPEQALQSFYNIENESADVLVIISRHKTDYQAMEFAEVYKQCRVLRKKSKVIIINAETITNSAKLHAKHIQAEDHIIPLPEFINASFYDSSSDVQYNMPLTQVGYSHLGLTVTRAIRATIITTKYKVIVVDADYTLWNGECAEGNVNFDQANNFLHKFLLKMKSQGVLLVILSKNSQQDVENVFETQQEEMVLRKNDFVCIIANWEQKSDNIRHVAELLRLGLNTFVFIDDNSLECEEMILTCPDVLTVQFPRAVELVSPLLDNLWMLDNMDISSESARRTEMYRTELIRQDEMKSLVTIESMSCENKLVEFLSGWNMKMTLCKTSVSLLKQNMKLHMRATELLHRTNQFKLNDVNTKLDEVSDEYACWLVSLEDRHGSYGIVSVVLFFKNISGSTVVTQWVLSCRALGREVEQKILCEIHEQTRKISRNLQLIVNQTGHNIPVLKFLKSLGCESNISRTDLTYITVPDIHLPKSVHNVHQVEDTDDLKVFEERVYNLPRKEDSHQHISKEYASSTKLISSLRDVNLWIQREWSPTQKQQAVHHNMFPIIPACEYFTAHDVKPADQDLSSREHILKLAWMEVLQSKKDPKATDNFLKCGGNSFSAVFLVPKLQRVCKVDINIIDLLQNPDYDCFKNIVLCANTIQDKTQEKQHTNDKCFSLSAAQQRMVFMQQTAPHSTAYVETIACHTRNCIKPADIFKSLVAQHPILTSRIHMDKENQAYVMSLDEELVFDVEPEVVEDFKSAEDYLTYSIPEIKILTAPLVKFRHLIAENLSILAVHMHHIIIDEITLNSISCDLTYLMSGATQKIHSNVQSYASFVDLERSYLTSSQYDADSKFWKENFKTLPPDANLAILPITESTWKDIDVCRARHSIKLIPTDTVEEISKYCNAFEVTAFQYYLACSLLVLQRYIGTDEITLAIPVTTRTDVYRCTDGLFVNTVLFRVVVDPSMTMKEYIKAVAESWLKTLCHSQYPLNEVVKWMWKKHGKSANCFCSVMFNYTSQSKSTNKLRVYSKHAMMPLCLDIIYNNEEKTNELLVQWAIGQINDSIAERLADGVVRMCCKALCQADSKLHDIDVLSPLEHDLLQSFNPHASKSFLKGSIPIHKAFEQHALINPDAPAVLCSGITWSYGELNEIASRIAHGLCQLIDKATLKSKPVVIVMKKDNYAIASILGIWKAGGHFLPIALTTQSCLKDALKGCTPAAVAFNVPLDTLPVLADKDVLSNNLMLNTEDLIKYTSEGYECSDAKLAERDLAYIIRTSGSTGRPKQCKISHQNLIIIASAWTESYKMNEFNVNVLQWAPLSFDVFVGDIVRSLICASGQLTICPDEFRLDVSYILSLIKEHKITIAEVTPQFGLHLIENASGEHLKFLKLFILGSDVLQCHLYWKIRNLLKEDQRVINSYGMTEATIDSSFFEGKAVPRTRSGTVPIGKPLPGVNFHILESRTLQPCPVGTIGELYITGDILASGDIELVQLKHVNCKGLKTGDAACWLPSGDVELMGRLDSMIKLRGFRISTTEIENKIVQLVKGVKDACVVPLINDDHRSSSGVEYLCAFVVQHENADEVKVNRFVVHKQLKGELAYYMLPDIVHIIDKIPLTAHGKVNHKALPKVSQLLEEKSEKAVENFSCNLPTVSALKELFAEALGIPDSNQIHIELTFMEQGGHSLVLIQFLSLIKQKSTFDVGIADLFSYPSIHTLADYINEKKARETEKYLQENTEKNEGQTKDEDIAVTGLGLRLPGGIMSLPQFWEALNIGNDFIGTFPEMRAEDVLKCISSSAAQIFSKSDTFQGAFLEQIDQFDNEFFKIAPGESKFLSPEQRLFLEVATEALAEGRKLSEARGANIGVFVGNSEVEYSQLNHPDEAVCISGLMPGMIATRVAYQWDLKGPTMLVDTACSSSLMAMKQACESIKRNECEGALVGGASLVLFPARTGVFGQSSILSPDFQCKAFDKDASGTAVGEGVLCLYVEPLSNALKREKPIYAVIKGIASNSVGHGNGITAPTSSSQQKVIQGALNAAKLKPSDVTFIESHGTGTKLGDRIELSALVAIFNEEQNVHSLPIGSVKSIFGHLDSAAGLLGVFKVLASLIVKQIAPTAHFKKPHDELINSSLYVPAETVPWKGNESGTRIAGVSSFGLTGTNCHALLAEPSNSPNDTEDQATGVNSFPLLFSGKNVHQIKKQVSLHKAYIQLEIQKRNGNILPSLCLTVAQRLKELAEVKVGHCQWRMVITAKDAGQMLKVIDIIDSTKDADALIQLSLLRSDVQVCCPQKNVVKSTTSAINSYLIDGKISLEDLFAGKHCHIKAAPGITVAMYNESRHWLEPTSTKGNGIQSENLLNLLQTKLNETREMVRTLPLAPTQNLQETEGRFCSAVIIKLLLSTDLAEYLEKSREITFTKAFTLSGMLAKYEKLFFVMIRELLENGLILATGLDESIHCLNSFKFKCDHFLNADPEIIANHAVEKYPLWADCFRFPLYCSKYLHEVLHGRMSPLSVIYPHGDLNFMYQFDKLGDLLGDVYYNMYMQVIAAHARHLSKEERNVRMLEVGAGVGYVTRQLLPKLKDTPNIEYWFTDLGKAFVEHAKIMFSEYQPMIKFSAFDITQSAPKQGLLGSFDIIISYNVIHTTQSIMESVANLKSCLSEDGALFIIESAKNETWATLAWGILDGWWYFKDYHLRPAEPMMEPEKWERVLKKVGFASVHSCPTNEYERSHVEKFLFICSAKELRDDASLDIPKLGWWETDVHKFDPIKSYSELECEVETSNGICIKEDSPIQRQAVHQELKRIWCELLGIDSIQADDDFNSLGGESLLAIQMMNLVHKRIGYQLEIADTFGYPTLGALANFIADGLDQLNNANSVSSSCPSEVCSASCISTVDKTGKSTTSTLSYIHATDDQQTPSTEVGMDDKELGMDDKELGTLLMFPGQGSQKISMCLSMKDSSEAKAVFERAEQLLGYNILDICLNDTKLKERLKCTEFVQVSLLVGCIARLEQLKTERPDLVKKVTHVAGLSVGEFAALVYAGAIAFEDALRLVQQRGKAMEDEVRQCSTGMVSIFGPNRKQLQDYLNESFTSMKISTYLADNQHTVAGTDEDCNALVEALLHKHEGQMEVIDVRRLRVAGAFHSPYMQQAAKVVNPTIESIEFSRPLIPVIMNVNGHIVEDPQEIKALLCEQLVAAVEWKKTILTAHESGVRKFIEISPSRVLSSIVKSRISECKHCEVEHVVV